MDQGDTVATEHRTVTPASPLPWTWHPKSTDQAHNGSIYRMQLPGHAYAIAMQPRYVDDKEFNANAAFIVRAANNHYALVKALELAEDILSRAPHSTAIWPNGMHPQTGIDQIRAALSAAKGET